MLDHLIEFLTLFLAGESMGFKYVFFYQGKAEHWESKHQKGEGKRGNHSNFYFAWNIRWLRSPLLEKKYSSVDPGKSTVICTNLLILQREQTYSDERNGGSSEPG